MSQPFPTIIDRFCHYEKVQPNKLFLSEPVKSVYQDFSWASAGKEIRSMAAWLLQSGLNPGDKVAILSKNCAHWIMADLAINMAGMVSVPLYPNITSNAVNEILLHSESKAIFVGKLDNPEIIRMGIPDTLTQISFPFYFNVGCLNWNDLVAATQPLGEPVKKDPKDLSCIIYTSGTTGAPKGVMHSNHTMSFAVYSFLESTPPLANEVFFSYLPLCHVAERMLVECGAIFTGSCIHFVESMDSFSKNLHYTQPTIFLAVPRIWEKIQEEILRKMPQQKLSRLLKLPLISVIIKNLIRKKLGLGRAKHLFTGASPINPAVLNWYKALGMEIQEAYGMTENSALSHSNRKGACKFGTVGQSYPGVDVKLSEQKEVLVKSEANMLGYYKEPVLSEEMFEEGFLKTGDEGNIDEDGYLTITGRIKDQFKTSKGKYVAPAPIESKVLTDAMIAQACVVGWGMPAPLLLCTLSEQAKNLAQTHLHDHLQLLLERINKELEHHEQLAKLIIMAEEWTIQNGILTPTLKIKRKVLDETFKDFYNNWYNESVKVVFV